MRPTITVRELEAFTLLAEHLNYKLAAEHAHVSQPALTRIIQSAEARLGARLFDRNTRRVELTPSGRELLPIAKRILGEFHGALSDLSEFISGHRGKIAVASLPSVAAALLPPVMAQLESSHPQITVALHPMSAQLLPDMVKNGTADFAVSTASAPDHMMGFEPLLREPFVLISALSDDVARSAKRPIDAIHRRPLITSGASSSIRPIVERLLAGRAKPLPEKYAVANISVLGAMVAHGLGVSLVPRMALSMMDMTRIHAAPIPSDVMAREIGIITRKGRSLSSASAYVIEALRVQATQSGYGLED